MTPGIGTIGIKQGLDVAAVVNTVRVTGFSIRPRGVHRGFYRIPIHSVRWGRKGVMLTGKREGYKKDKKTEGTDYSFQ